MNKKKLLALLVSSAFLFAACGEDEAPLSPVNGDDEISSSSEDDDCESSDECGEDDVSSSSKKGDGKSSSSKADDKNSSDSKGDEKKSSDSKDEKSSSSKDGDNSKSSSSNAKPESSSSSVTPESSSSVYVPSGARAATLEDLEKNIELNLFGQKVILSTGSKQGLISLRIPDELWVITYTNFANGQVTFVHGDVGIQYSDTDAAKTIKNKIDTGIKLSFIVDEEGVVKYDVNESKEYSETVSTKVSLQSGKLSKASELKDKVYKCTVGDTSKIFTFFDNSYIFENSVGDKVVDWMAGHYDIHRSTLLMRPAYYNASVTTMFAYSVGTNQTIATMDGKSMSCGVESKDVTYQKSSDLVGEWQALNSGIEWEFTLKANGTYDLSAFENNKNVESKSGVWEIYGDQLMMRNKGCLHPDKCSTSTHGVIEKTSDGFKYYHSDSDTPKIPKSFESVQYE